MSDLDNGKKGTFPHFDNDTSVSHELSETLVVTDLNISTDNTTILAEPPAPVLHGIPMVEIPMAQYEHLLNADFQLRHLLDNISIINDAFETPFKFDGFFAELRQVIAELCAIVDDGLDDLPRGVKYADDFWTRNKEFILVLLPFIRQTIPLSNFDGMDVSYLPTVCAEKGVNTDNIEKMIAFFSDFKPTVTAIREKYDAKKEAATLPTKNDIASVALKFVKSKINFMDIFKIFS